MGPVMEYGVTDRLDKWRQINLGVVTLSNPLKDQVTIKRRGAEMMSALQLLGISALQGEPMVTDVDSLAAVIAQLKQARVDCLVVVVGSYTSDDTLLELANAFPWPLILWAPPEALSPEAFPPFASLVGLTQNAGTLQRRGYRVYSLYGELNTSSTAEQLGCLLHAYATVQALRQARIGRIGAGCPGMLDTQFDTALLRDQLGVEVVDLPIQDFINLYQSLSDDIVAPLVDQAKILDVVSQVAEADYRNSIKTYAALRMLAEQNDLTAMAVRCWPELKAQDVVSPCLGLSLLTDQGIPAGCEGDACGAISMLIAQLITGRPAFFGDFVAIDDASDEIQMFHCGAGACSLAEPGYPVTFKTHSRPTMWKPGITVEFPVGPGPATYLRFGLQGHGFRILMEGGEALRHSPHSRGTTLRFKPRHGGRAVLGGLLAAGAEHHQIVAQGDVSSDLNLVSELWGITPQKVVDD